MNVITVYFIIIIINDAASTTEFVYCQMRYLSGDTYNDLEVKCVKVVMSFLDIWLTDSLTHSLTHSMGQSPPWEGNSHSIQKFPAFYRTQRFITVFTIARHMSLS
jgi:hypothetical protein